MALVQNTRIKTTDLVKVTLEYGDQPVKLTLDLKDGKQHTFTADEHRTKTALLLDAKILQEKLGL